MTRTTRLALWFIGAAALAGALTGVRIDSDLTRFVATGGPDAEVDLAAAIQRGPAGRLVLIGVQAADPRSAADTSRRWVADLRASGRFSSVHNGDPALLAAEAEAVIPFRYHLSDRIGPGTFTEAGLKAGLRRAEALLADARGWLVQQLLPRDPTLETLHLVEQWRVGPGLPLREGVWFSTSGRRALIIATTRAAGDDAAAQGGVDAALRELADATRRRDATVSVEYTGLGLLAAQARRETRERVERLAIISLILVTAVLALSYRRALPVALSLAPALIGVAAGCVATQAIFGDVNLLALAFASVLVDEGSDYPSYLLTQARYGEPIGAEARRIWPTLRLALLTSTAAFAVLLAAQFRGLQQLGLLCAVGLLAAGVAARWLLPDVLDPQRGVTWSPPAAGARLGAARRGLSSRSAWLANGAAIVAAVIALVAAQPLWNDGVAAINPLRPERIAEDRALRAEAGLPLDQRMLVFVGPDAESVLQAQESWAPAARRLAQRGEIASFDMAALYLPSRKMQAARLSEVPDAAELRRRLAAAAGDTSFNADAFEPFVEDASRARATTLGVESLPAGLVSQRVESLLPTAGGRVSGLVPVALSAGADDVLQSARAVVQGTPVEVSWFETRARLSGVLTAVRERLVGLLLVCALAVWGVVLLDLRSVARSVRVMLPVATAIALTAAVARLAFGPLNVFNVVALMLTLGVLTNYSLFIHVPPRFAGAQQRRAHAAFSLLVASSTTLAVFAALGASGIAVVEAVGRTVVVGIIVGLGWLLATRAESLPPPGADSTADPP